MKNIVIAIAYASAWIATSIAVIFAIKYTDCEISFVEFVQNI